MEQLRPSTSGDRSRLLELLSLPMVFEFLCDGSPPQPQLVDEWIAPPEQVGAPMGLWLLESETGCLLGCVRLSPWTDQPASAELTYVLHPSQWGRGLATAMSRSAISAAFGHEGCDSILAGADVANHRSIEVMKRLGMQLLRTVEYPAGPGVEYRLTRSRFWSLPPARTLPIRLPW